MAVSKSTVRIVCAAVCVGRIFQKAVALCQDLEEGEFEVAVDEEKGKKTLLSSSLRDQASRYQDAITNNMLVEHLLLSFCQSFQIPINCHSSNLYRTRIF